MVAADADTEGKARVRRRDRPRVRYALEYAALVAGSRLLRLCPRRWVEALGRSAGVLLYYLLGSRRRIALRNLDLALGDRASPSDKRRIAREALANVTSHFVDFLTYGKYAPEQLASLMDLQPEGRRLLDEVMARGRGVIFLVSHFCHWELLGIFFGTLEPYQWLVVAKPMHNARVDRWVNRVRALSGNRIIYSGEANLKVLRALRRGEGVAIVFDQDTSLSRGGVYTKFFGQDCVTTRAPATFSLATGAPILPVYCLPRPGGRFEVRVQPPLEFSPSGDREADTQALTQLCNNVTEVYIREHPQYYFWLHRRWKHRPPGSPAVYEDQAGGR